MKDGSNLKEVNDRIAYFTTDGKALPEEYSWIHFAIDAYHLSSDPVTGRSVYLFRGPQSIGILGYGLEIPKEEAEEGDFFLYSGTVVRPLKIKPWEYLAWRRERATLSKRSD